MGENKNVDDFLKAVCLDQEVAGMEDGTETLVGNGGVRLSGGQGQRLALARTLCHKKPVLILDDPFSALDKTTERQIFANLKELVRDNIVLLISHRLYLFPEMDQIIWMERQGEGRYSRKSAPGSAGVPGNSLRSRKRKEGESHETKRNGQKCNL